MFEYFGTVNEGTRINFTGKPFITSAFYKAILREFSGKSIYGGFSMTDPILGGLGEWIEKNSKRYSCQLSPRHGSFIAAILVHEGYIRSSLQGTKVVLHFSANRDCLFSENESYSQLGRE
jgi:hypothetical protein